MLNPTAATFFTTYEAMKNNHLPRFFPSLPPSLIHMLAASSGELAACLVRVPTEVIKTRAQTSAYGGKTGSLEAAKMVWRSEGIRGFGRGFGMTVAREVSLKRQVAPATPVVSSLS